MDAGADRAERAADRWRHRLGDLACGTRARRRVGTVAAATALVLRLNSMTYWIMWATTSLVQALGVVAEGMETIAQPITLVDAPGAQAAGSSAKGRIEIDGVCAPLRARLGRAAGRVADHPPGREDRPCRPVGRGQIDARQADAAVLRHRRRAHPDRRAGHRATSRRTACAARSAWCSRTARLLHRSVRDNILYGRPEATEAEMIAAAQRAEAHDFILTLEDPEGRRAMTPMSANAA